MKQRTIRIFFNLTGIALGIGLCGCATKRLSETEAWVERHPLGKEFATFRPPGDANASAQPPLIDEPEDALTLRRALALALAGNSELAAFSWDVRIGEARQLQAGLYPNPEAGAEVENIAGSGDFRGTREAETTLQLSQLILLGGKRAKAIEEARLSRDLAAWDYETVRLEIFRRTANEFVEALAARQHLALNEELVRLAEQVVQAVQQRVNAAKSSTVELTRAKVALDLARIDRDQSQSALAAARQRLSANWGNPQPTFETVVGNLRELPSVPSLEELNHRLEKNPVLARWAAEREQRRAALRLEESRAIPDLTVGVGYRRIGGSDDNALVAGVSIPLPLFNRNQGNIREAEHRLTRAGEEQRAAEVRLRTALGQAWQAYDSARATLESLQTTVLPGAQRAFETANEYYEQGRFSFLDVLDAQRTLFTSRAREIRALSDYHQAVNEIDRLVGETSRNENRESKEETNLQ